MSRRGFTLVELLVALILMGIVSTAVYQLLVNNQRVYQQQTQRVQLNETLRSAVAILPAELREEDATDPIASDIVAMTTSSITFKAMRNLYQICQTPVNMGGTGSVTVYQTPFFGLRRLETGRDSVTAKILVQKRTIAS